MGNSLAIHLLELHALTAEGPGLIPVLGTKIPQAPAKNKKPQQCGDSLRN